MRKKFPILLVFLFACILAGALVGWRFLAPQIMPEQGSSNTKLYLNWIYAGSFAGDVAAEQKFDTQNGIEIATVEGGQGRDPIRLVQDGEFGIASADDVLRAISKGRKIVIVGVANRTHPAAFAALQSSGITRLQDFPGKRIGLLPFGSTGTIYSIMLRKAGVDRRSIKEIVVSPDLKPFISGRVNDVQPVFIFDETVTLDQQGVRYNVIKPVDYGVSYIGPVYFTTASTAKEHPELVTRFRKSITQGWEFAASNPDEAIQLLVTRAPKIDRGREVEVLKRAAPYFVRPGEPTLGASRTEWERMIADMREAGELGELPQIETWLLN